MCRFSTARNASVNDLCIGCEFSSILFALYIFMLACTPIELAFVRLTWQRRLWRLYYLAGVIVVNAFA